MAGGSAINDVELCEVCGLWRFVTGGHLCQGSRVEDESAELAGRDGDTTHG